MSSDNPPGVASLRRNRGERFEDRAAQEAADVTVVVPTYNEADGLEPLFSRTCPTLDGEDWSYEILLVDDDSPDGTGAVATELGERTGWPVRTLLRTENPGLSESVVDGLKRAVGSVCIVMDADLQHPPEKLPEMIRTIEGGADVVVGTRRTHGGNYGEWSRGRYTISGGADALARAAVPSARPLSDPMSGFFGLRRDAVNVSSLSPRGFKILLEVLSVGGDLTVAEVGYTFGTRQTGESKLDTDEIIKFVEHLAQCRLRASPGSDFVDPRRAVQMIEFGAIGGIGTLINMGVFLTVLGFSTNYLLAGYLAFLVAVQWNFFGNWTLTFDAEDSLLKRYSKFHLVSVGGLVVYQLMLALLIGQLALPAAPANLVAITSGALWNYTGSEQIAFKSP